MKRALLLFTVLFVGIASCAVAQNSPGSPASTDPPRAAPATAFIQFELWQWGDEPTSRKKLFDIRDGAKLQGELLPWTGMQFRFRVTVLHDTILCEGHSDTNFEKAGWGPEPVRREGSHQAIYRYRPDAFIPATGHYSLTVEARD